MGEYSFGKTLNIVAGADTDVNLLTIPSAKKFTLTEVQIHFPSGCDYNIQLYFKRGEEQILPNENYFASDHSPIKVVCNILYQSGEVIVVHTKNLDASNPYKVWIFLKGILE